MPARSSFDYAILRVVPRVEREEFVNVGAVVFCLEHKFLQARVHVDEARLLALCPDLQMDVVCRHLEAFVKVCAGTDDAGPIGKLSLRERFHWVVAPRSTIIQVSPVHSGLCESPERALDDAFRRFVLTSPQT